MTTSNTSLNVWLLQTGEPLHIDDHSARPMRAMNLANALVENGHKVVLWSSAFYHQDKRHRTAHYSSYQINKFLEIRLIPSPGYSKNIGLKRLWDHAVMAQNLKKQLSTTNDRPNVAFIGYPPIEVAAVMGNWLKKNKIPFILDIKDLWPTIFIDTLPGEFTKTIGKSLLYPYYLIAKNIIRKANGISSMSHSFLKWAYNFSKKNTSTYDIIVPLTSPEIVEKSDELKTADEWWNSIDIKNDGKPRVCFVGSHSQAFDMQPIHDAAMYFHSKNIPCDFIICGHGPLSEEWKGVMKDLPNVFFPGWIDRTKTKALATRCMAALAPYKNTEDFVFSLPNKILDSLSLGLPILSPLKGEVHKMINEEKVGLIYGEVSNVSLQSCIEKLMSNKKLHSEISDNAYKLYKKNYSYTAVYYSLVKHLEEMYLTQDTYLTSNK